MFWTKVQSQKHFLSHGPPAEQTSAQDVENPPPARDGLESEMIPKCLGALKALLFQHMVAWSRCLSCTFRCILLECREKRSRSFREVAGKFEVHLEFILFSH